MVGHHQGRVAERLDLARLVLPLRPRPGVARVDPEAKRLHRPVAPRRLWIRSANGPEMRTMSFSWKLPLRVTATRRSPASPPARVSAVIGLVHHERARARDAHVTR